MTCAQPRAAYERPHRRACHGEQPMLFGAAVVIYSMTVDTCPCRSTLGITLGW
jgi:hypothetical protein